MEFLKAHVWPIVTALAGMAMAAYGGVAAARDMQTWGVEPWAWIALGIALTFVALIVFFYQIHRAVHDQAKRNVTAEPLSPPQVEPAKPTVAQVKIDQRVTSNHQTGGVTAHTVTMPGAARRILTESDKEMLVRRLLKERFVQIDTPMSDSEAQFYGDQIRRFLVSQGYNVGGLSFVVWSGPVFGLSVSGNVIRVGSRH